MYSIRFSQIAYSDMSDIVSYISHDLNNYDAAKKLAHKFIESSKTLVDFPYGRPVYHPLKHLEHEYRKLIVNNYTMFYWINGDIKTVYIERVVYSGSYQSNYLK